MKKELVIKWQRLMYNGETCPRCSDTEKEIKKAIDALKKICENSNIKLKFKKEKITKKEFEKNPLESNRIFINNKPIENYINAKTGKSKCCNICGNTDCRTIIVKKNQFEVISSDIIIQAALTAISEILK